MSMPPPPGQYGPYDPQSFPVDPGPYGQPCYPQPWAGYPPGYVMAYPQATPPRLSDPMTGWLMIVAGLVGVIGSLTPWAYVDAFGVSINGTNGDGKLSVVCALIVAVMGLLVVLRQGRLWTSIVGLVFAVFVALIGGIDLGDINQLYGSGRQLPDGFISSGYGIWLVLVGGVLGIAFSIAAMVRRGPQVA